MSSQQNILPASAMPLQIIQPLAAGATSPMQSAQINQHQQIQKQMALIGKTGGSKRRGTQRRKTRQLRGGFNGVVNNSRILVPSLQPGAVNSQLTTSQYVDLTALASKQQSQAVYDNGNTAAVAATQKGGKRTQQRRKMKGGTWPIWGCLSGGKQSRRKNRRYKKNKRNTKIKRRYH